MKGPSPPTAQERATAAAAARALRAAIAEPTTMGARSTMHVDYARPRRGAWITTWANLPGFVREDGAGGTSYRHESLPGWQYARSEIAAEMIPDLEALAEHGVRPSSGTTLREPVCPLPSPQPRIAARDAAQDRCAQA